VAKGRVQPKRLQTVGLGETQLKVAPGSSDAEAPNRRVAVIPIQ
jgi:outer membrane protein OmpA-like peptidoglycan-associated protein